MKQKLKVSTIVRCKQRDDVMDDVSCADVGAARICARTYIARAEKRGGGKIQDRFLCVCNLTSDLAVFTADPYT